MPNMMDPQSFNRYSYVNNNPVRYTDPTGHMIKDEDDAGGGTDDPEHPTGQTTITTENANDYYQPSAETAGTQYPNGKECWPHCNDGEVDDGGYTPPAYQTQEATGTSKGMLLLFGFTVKSCHLWERCAVRSVEDVTNVTTGERAEFICVGPTDTPEGSQPFVCLVLCLSVDVHVGIGETSTPYNSLNQIYGGWFDNRGFDIPAFGVAQETSSTANILVVSWGPSIPSAYNIPTYATQVPYTGNLAQR